MMSYSLQTNFANKQHISVVADQITVDSTDWMDIPNSFVDTIGSFSMVSKLEIWGDPGVFVRCQLIFGYKRDLSDGSAWYQFSVNTGDSGHKVDCEALAMIPPVQGIPVYFRFLKAQIKLEGDNPTPVVAALEYHFR